MQVKIKNLIDNAQLYAHTKVKNIKESRTLYQSL